jgi:hypothetical protein
MEFFASDNIGEEYFCFETEEQIQEYLSSISQQFLSTLSYDELQTLKFYTGTSYKEINAIMRKKWTYEENGLLTKEKENEYTKTGEDMRRIISKCPSLNMNLKVYRGVSLKQFQDYGITSLDQLPAMEGKYLYDQGFTSTSLMRDKSLVGVSNFFTGDRNIEIEYLVPASCQDGALLLGNQSSYYDNEDEYLINASNLTKILSVNIDKENNKAYIRAILIPKMLWDPPYQMGETNINNKMG